MDLHNDLIKFLKIPHENFLKDSLCKFIIKDKNDRNPNIVVTSSYITINNKIYGRNSAISIFLTEVCSKYYTVYDQLKDISTQLYSITSSLENCDFVDNGYCQGTLDNSIIKCSKDNVTNIADMLNKLANQYSPYTIV